MGVESAKRADTEGPYSRDPRYLVLCPATLAMLRASQGRRWEGRRTKAHLTCVEDEDASSGVTGRHERGKRLLVGALVPGRSIEALTALGLLP